jgi:hypothetical protein
MTMDEALDLVVNAQARLIRIRQEFRQMDQQLAEVENVLEQLAKRLAPPEQGADDGIPSGSEGT